MNVVGWMKHSSRGRANLAALPRSTGTSCRGGTIGRSFTARYWQAAGSVAGRSTAAATRLQRTQSQPEASARDWDLRPR